MPEANAPFQMPPVPQRGADQRAERCLTTAAIPIQCPSIRIQSD
jgi:hypothetical protein